MYTKPCYQKTEYKVSERSIYTIRRRKTPDKSWQTGGWADGRMYRDGWTDRWTDRGIPFYKLLSKEDLKKEILDVAGYESIDNFAKVMELLGSSSRNLSSDLVDVCDNDTDSSHSSWGGGWRMNECVGFYGTTQKWSFSARMVTGNYGINEVKYKTFFGQQR